MSYKCKCLDFVPNNLDKDYNEFHIGNYYLHNGDKEKAMLYFDKLKWHDWKANLRIYEITNEIHYLITAFLMSQREMFRLGEYPYDKTCHDHRKVPYLSWDTFQCKFRKFRESDVIAALNTPEFRNKYKISELESIFNLLETTPLFITAEMWENLEKRIKTLEEIIEYRPGGVEYQKAAANFKAHVCDLEAHVCDLEAHTKK